MPTFRTQNTGPGLLGRVFFNQKVRPIMPDLKQFQDHWAVYSSDIDREPELLFYRGQSTNFAYCYRLACHNKLNRPGSTVALMLSKGGPVNPDPVHLDKIDIILLSLPQELEAVAALLPEDPETHPGNPGHQGDPGPAGEPTGYPF